MSIYFKRIQLLCGILLVSISLSAQKKNYISLKQITEILENNKKMTNEVDLFYDNNKQIITKHYHSSTEFVVVANSLGELKTYYPARNEVEYKQITELSSKRSLIYYFANNLTDQLGLAEEGFKLTTNTYENQFYVTTWTAPSYLKGIEKVKMVFENGFPVYSEYQASKKKIVKKIYYTNYKDFSEFRLPLKIIEINYMPKGDSIISRTNFTDVKAVSTPDNNYFNFKIPDDAKPFGNTKVQ